MMADDRPRRRLPPTSLLDALCMAYSDAPVGTFPDALGDALIDVLADYDARLTAQADHIRYLETALGGLQDRLTEAARILNPYDVDDEEEDDDGG
jgi:hypothetical protein